MKKSLLQTWGNNHYYIKCSTVMRIIINKKIIHVFKEDNQCDIPLQFKQASSIDKN